MPGEALKFGGRDAFIIAPPDAADVRKDVPWVWYAPTLSGLPSAAEKWMFEKFVAEGIAIAGIDVGESYGSPDGCAAYSAFYRYLTGQRGFRAKPCLLARSRGGLMLYNWAAENPGKVGGIAGIYPVGNLESYPGLARACGAYGLTEAELRGNLATYNPIDRLAALAKAKVPVLHIHGDSDKVVPLDANSGELIKRYQALGGPGEVIVVPGRGHDMWDGWFQSERLADFATACALGKEPRQAAD